LLISILSFFPCYIIVESWVVFECKIWLSFDWSWDNNMIWLLLLSIPLWIVNNVVWDYSLDIGAILQNLTKRVVLFSYVNSIFSNCILIYLNLWGETNVIVLLLLQRRLTTSPPNFNMIGASCVLISNFSKIAPISKLVIGKSSSKSFIHNFRLWEIILSRHFHVVIKDKLEWNFRPYHRLMPMRMFALILEIGRGFRTVKLHDFSLKCLYQAQRVSGINLASVSIICSLDFRTVQMVCYFLFFILFEIFQLYLTEWLPISSIKAMIKRE
jgi:hypothetical protein